MGHQKFLHQFYHGMAQGGPDFLQIYGITRPCARFSTLPAASTPWARTVSGPASRFSSVISHSAKFGAVARASLPFTRTLATVPLSAVVPHTCAVLRSMRRA